MGLITFVLTTNWMLDKKVTELNTLFKVLLIKKNAFSVIEYTNKTIQQIS